MSGLETADDPRTCPCGCGRSLEGRRGNVRYVDRTHQQRVYRAKVKAEAEAKGIPGSLSFKTVRAARATSNHHIDGPRGDMGAQRARKRPSRTPNLRISYRKAVEAVAVVLAADDADEMWTDFARMDAERILRPLLTDHQRAALAQRGPRT